MGIKMRENGNQKKVTAFCLACMICMLQIMTPLGNLSVRKVKAETGPDDVASITATGAAFAVDPTMVVSNARVLDTTTTTINLQWDAAANTTEYYLYRYSFATGKYEYLASTVDSAYQIAGLKEGEECYITIAAVNSVIGCRSDFIAPLHAATRPLKVEGFTIDKNTTTSVTLTWTGVPSATGYLIYRAGTGGNFSKVGAVDATDTTDAATVVQYVDKSLEAGKTYQYKIITYSLTQDNVGEESPVVFTSTLPSAPKLTIKGGDEKIRLTWNAVSGATGYTVYTNQNGQFTPLSVLEGKSNKMFIQKEIPNGEMRQYYVTAYRIYNEVKYESAQSNIGEATAKEVDETSTEPKIYTTKASFKKSNAYLKCKEFKKKVNYNKSFPIPGMVHTNVAGFSCTSMIPQGITYAKSYILITAYDSTKVENSVVYVLRKSNRKLLTTAVLPNKAHAGGIAYDGRNVWITQSTTLRSFPLSTITEAVDNEEPYVEIAQYNSECEIGQQAATVDYYKGMLWVASYNELKAGSMVSCEIESKKGSPELTVIKSYKMPDRVQGIAFTKNGRLIVSRSCQTDSKKRGFYHRIDVYKPDVSDASSGEITLGKVKKSIDMPTMNEEIAVSGSFLYVNFESVSFVSAVNRVDRVCAFPLGYVTKIPKEKKL